MKVSGNYTGINIQWPISQLILAGRKSIETRTYPIPAQYIGRRLAFIETPGRKGEFDARVVAIIVFGESFKYASEKAFYADVRRHHVRPDSNWAWSKTKPKWGWPILEIRKLERPYRVTKKKGIIFTKDIPIY